MRNAMNLKHNHQVALSVGGNISASVASDFDTGLRDHMLSIYSYMSGGLAVTGLMAQLTPETHLRVGSPRKEIPPLVKEIDADLVVMRAVNRSGNPGLFVGNTPEAILTRLGCSILVVEPSVGITPVTA